MKSRTFLAVLLGVVGVCVLLTVLHLVYAVYAYQHGSIIQFIAQELW